MAELDELADRGLLAEAEKRSVRAETGRRLLAAAQRGEAPLKTTRPTTILIAAALAPLVALGAYVAIGAPGLPDQPFARRLAEWRKVDPESLTAPQMAAILRAMAVERPADPEPLRQLAVAELASNEPMEAVQALERAVAIAPGRADLWEMLGEVQVVRAQGEVGDDALDAFRRAIAVDPRSATARYYLARARIAGGDVAGGLADWRALDAELAPGDARRTTLDADIQTLTATGRLQPLQPAPQPGVGQAEIQAMVDGLAARLQANPDDPAGWVRLVRAYTVLGETDRRDAALAQARSRYAARPDVLQDLDAAMRPGVVN
jgi:cytochrome c-type biogenesis protein CcmH